MRDIMIPRAQMDCVSIDDDPPDFLPVILETKHSRFPVIGESKDDVVGILLAKELLNYYANPEGFVLRDTLRPAVFVPESKRLNVLLREFRANRNHIAIVVDEYGGVSGLVTIEDVLEQIVGDIEDEYDFDESIDNVIPEANGRFRVKAQTEIADFNAHFGTSFENEEFHTVGGLVLKAFGRLPKRGEATTIEGLRFRVLRADSRRLHTLQVERVAPPSAAGATGESAGPTRRPSSGAPRSSAAERADDTAARAPARRRGAAGAITVFGFAPFGVAPLPVLTLAVLFALWQDAAPRAPRPRGFAFGLGLFGAGASWVYIALETFGGMPTALALLATAGFVAYLALWPALAGYVAARFTAPSTVGRALAAAAAWTLGEWLRGYVFTGFPWLAVGYAQLPGSALAGYAPWGGVFAVSFAVALCAAMVALTFDAIAIGSRRCVAVAAATVVTLLLGGSLGSRVEWTEPEGKPLAVSLVQGNVAQTLKFDPGFREKTFAIYAELVERSRGRLIVLPESAYPMFSDEVPDAVILHLIRTAEARGGDVLLGLFTAEKPAPGTSDPRYFNTVVALGASDVQLYRKRHLVPFGETIPGKPVLGWFIRNVLAIPLADQTPGAAHQPPLAVVGARVAVNICYEDAFGAELSTAHATRASWST